MDEAARVFLHPYFADMDAFFAAAKSDVHNPVPQFYRQPGQRGASFRDGGAETSFIGSLPQDIALQTADEEAGFSGGQGIQNRLLGGRRTAGKKGFASGKE
jgi:hypothetical protein